MIKELSDYELWVIDMELAGKRVPDDGETIYIPYEDDADCWSETWDGNPDQQEYLERGLCFSTANEAVAKARHDMEVALYENSTPAA